MKWDLWAYAAIILESDMPKKKYLAANREATSLKLAEEHIAHKDTCGEIKELVRKTLLEKDIERMLKLDQIIDLV